MRPFVIDQEKYLLIHHWLQLAFRDDFPFRAISQAACDDKLFSFVSFAVENLMLRPSCARRG